jgi:hypothetical protein
MRLRMTLPVAYWKVNNKVHQNVRPWAAWLRQWFYASMQPMPYRAHMLAGRVGPSIGLDLVCHA